MIQEYYISFLDDREKLRVLFLALSQTKSRNDNCLMEKDQISGLSYYTQYFAE